MPLISQIIQLGAGLIKLPRYSNNDGGKFDVFLRLKKSLYGQDESARIWFEKFWNSLLDHGFMVSKVDPFLFMSKTVIGVVYVDDFLFWSHSQTDIDKVMNSLKEDGPNYNWEHSKGESVSEFWWIDIKTLNDGGFQFYQSGSTHKVLEAAGMEHCNGLPTTTKVEEPLGTDDNGHKAKRDWPNSYGFVIGMMLYLAPNTRPDI